MLRWAERHRCEAQPVASHAEAAENIVGGGGGADGALLVTNSTTGPSLTAAVPDDQVPSLLQVYGQQVGERAGEVTHAIAGFPKSLHRRRSKFSQLSWAPGREFQKHF